MSLFDSASLIVTPSGYKEDKLYSIKPTDGSGDLVVTRATTATRVNSDGLIEQVPYNLLTYSEQFDNAAWTKSNATITANTTISPDGNNNADTYNVVSTTANLIYQNPTLTTGAYSISVYAKKASSNIIRLFNVSSGTSAAWFDLNLGQVIGTVNGGTALIENAGNGWYRCVYKGTSITSGFTGIGLSDTANSATASIGSSVFIWGAQLVSGTSAKEYFPTTDRLDVPRLDYTNSSCPSILVEPQRTNVALRSEEFDNAYWEKYRCDLSANSQISPSGIQNADTFTSSVGQSFVPAIATTNITFLGNTRYSFSIYVKKIGTTDSFVLGYVDNSTGYTGGKASYNLTTQSITITQSPNSSVTASMQSVGNGWYRLVLNFLTIATPTYNYIELNIPSKTTTNTFAIWGAQLEQGSYATSYVPTIASSVTRNADVISKTGISSLIGQTEGTIFFEADIQKLNENNFYIGISNGVSLGEAIYLSQPSSGNINVLFRTAGLTPTITILSANWNIGYNKIAIAYNESLGEVFINGVSKGTVALTALPTCDRIVIGSRLDNPGTLVGSGGYKSAILFKTRLSNTELAQLTTI